MHIQGDGAPTKYTSGEIGDIYTNVQTNRSYKCIRIYIIKDADSLRYEYDWELIVDDSSDTLITLVVNSIEDGKLQLTTDRYQKVEMLDNTEIVLPTVDSFTEIHLFFTTTSALTLKLPDGRYQRVPTINANKAYELIFTYIDEWLIGYIEYDE